MRNPRHIALFLFFAAALAGCAVGPNYRPPKVKLAPTFGELAQTTATDPKKQPSSANTNSPPAAAWWRLFNDPQLDQLIEQAVRENYDLRIATARVRQARAQRGIVAADLFPQINADAGYIDTRGSQNVTIPLSGAGGSSGGSGGTGKSGASAARSADPPASSSSSSGSGGSSSSGFGNQLTPFGKGGLPGVTTELYQAGFDANWELDIFGGTRRRVEAANADIAAAVENQRDVMITLLAEVARDYLELRGAQQRLAVGQRNLAAQRNILELTRSLRSAGLVTELDVTRAAAQVATTASTLPAFEAQIRQSIHALSTLVAKEPTALSASLAQSKPIPPVPPEVPVGLPSDLLRRRPDIRQAERRVAAATARIGSAKADLFPKFTLTGSMGLDSSSISHLFEWESRYFLINPNVVWPIFDAGRIASNIRLQKANAQESVLQYRSTILGALQEVEDSLILYSTEQSRRTSLFEALTQSQQSLELAREQYRNGLVDFLTVLDAQRNLLAAQDALVQSNQTVSTDLVALYKALGGGWEVFNRR